jgi:hypothetical protein
MYYITCRSFTDGVFALLYSSCNFIKRTKSRHYSCFLIERIVNNCRQTELVHPKASSFDSSDNNLKMACGTTNDGQLSIQHLLALAKQRTQQMQSKLTLRQLKEQARIKARSSSKDSHRMQPKRAKRSRKNQPSHVSNKQHSEVIKMNTGILYLCRGEHRRVRFVRNK